MVTFAMSISCPFSPLVENDPAVVQVRVEHLVYSHGSGGSTFHCGLFDLLQRET